MGKVNCEACAKSCKGQAIKLQDRYFHLKCFKCQECKKPLATGGFYTKNDTHYCVEDYQRLFGVRCHACGEFVEGEVVTALGNTYHEGCFQCTKCNKKFDPGDKVTFSHKDYLCNDCLESCEIPSSVVLLTDLEASPPPVRDESNQKTGGPLKGSTSAPSTPAKQENSLMDGHLSSPALDYSSDAKPLENGVCGVASNHSYHTPGTNTSGYKSDVSYDRNTPASRYSDVFDGSFTDGNCKENEPVDVFLESDDKFPYYYGPGRRSRLSPIQNIMRYRSTSPAGSTFSHASRKSKESTASMGSRFDGGDYGKFLKTSYLEKMANFKRGPSINPIQKEKSPKHYHRPENFSYTKVRRDFIKPAKKGLLTALGDRDYKKTLRQLEPYRPIKTQEPIQLSKIPDAQKDDHHVAPIERDDWPAPPAPAAAYPDLLREHRLHRKSADMTDGVAIVNVDETTDRKIERDIKELSKMTDSGAAKVILEDLKKLRTDGPVLDPRSSSRVPSAANEPHYKTRYESSIFASPSRDLDQRLRLRSLECLIERKYRTSTLPLSNFPVDWRNYELPKNLVRSLEVPRPGYSLTVRSSALDNRNRYSFEGIDLSVPRRPDSSAAVLQRTSYYSSQSSMEDYDPTTGLRKNRLRSSAALSEGFMSPYFGYRRSVPSLFKVEEPLKIYTYEQLKEFGAKQLPPDVDKDAIEQHLSLDEFESVFGMSRDDFYRLAEWKRNDMKTRVGLF